MKRIGTVRTAIKLPLIGLSAAWLLFMIADYVQSLVPRGTYEKNGDYIYPDPRFTVEIYLFFAGITAFALFALAGQKLALRLRTEED